MKPTINATSAVRRWGLAAALLLFAGPWSAGAAPAAAEIGSLGRFLRPPAGRAAPFTAAPELAVFLKENGYAVVAPGVIVHRQSGMDIPPPLLQRAGIAFDQRGLLAYLNSGLEVERAHLPGILAGLLEFSRAYAPREEEAGEALRGMGYPPVYDGKHILNPDGSATYFGMMLYEGIRRNSAPPKAVSGERLGRALDLMASAFEQGFMRSAPDVAAVDMRRAWGLLEVGAREGETPVDLRPFEDPGASLTAYADGIARAAAALKNSADSAAKRELAAAGAAVDALSRFKHYPGMDLSAPPVPPAMAAAVAPPPSTGVLPGLLRVLDRLNGTPLSPEQIEALVKSFPMGETLWRLGAPELWRAGLTGKGVKVAVIDTGVAPHAELEDAVKSRDNFTHQRGADAAGFHGTHVAGTIHSLAPDAEIRSYKALDGEPTESNPMLLMDGDEVMQAISAAVDKAVADGNQVVNLSLGMLPATPNGALARKIEEYARRGVLFIVAAGNEGLIGVGTPSVAESVVSVGALTSTDRPAAFSSYGVNFDASRPAYAIKTIFMAPGTNIISAIKGDGYGPSSGTSMATPHVTGAAALLLQGFRIAFGIADPLDLSRRLVDALARSGRPVRRDLLPAAAPPDQDFIIVDPAAAWRKGLKASV